MKSLILANGNPEDKDVCKCEYEIDFPKASITQWICA
jgi:hypothetical protein